MTTSRVSFKIGGVMNAQKLQEIRKRCKSIASDEQWISVDRQKEVVGYVRSLLAHTAALETQIKQLEAERDQIKATLTDLQLQYARLLTDVDTVSAENAALKKDLAYHAANWQAAEDEVVRLEVERDRLREITPAMVQAVLTDWTNTAWSGPRLCGVEFDPDDATPDDHGLGELVTGLLRAALKAAAEAVEGSEDV